MSGARFDVAVIGAGFGGLGAALTLASHGAKVVLCETLNYPGGCASTFKRDGYRFEAGATLFAGLAEGQLFGDWIRRYQMPVEIEWIDPLLELRTPDLRLEVGRSREALVETFCDLPGAPRTGIRAFFDLQRRVADTLWALFDAPDLLPPLNPTSILRHAARLPAYLRLLPLVGRPLGRLLDRFGLSSFTPLRTWLDGLCQITVQCDAASAEAPFALSAMDYYFRGTGHVRGGIGSLARAMLEAVERQGGTVQLANQVRRLEATPSGWTLTTRRGPLEARYVVANLLPQNLRALLDAPPGRLPRLDRLADRLETGWGAAMLYLVARAPEGASSQAHHLELIQDSAAAFTEGNHLFVSISSAADEGRAPEGRRTLTVSTHVPMGRLARLDDAGRANYIADIQATMRRGLERLAPEWWAGLEHLLPASPRIFERFTRRYAGYVGGIPRWAGMHNYREMWPRPVVPGLYLVGDSVFPGQSVLATAVGGQRVAEAISRRL